MSKSNILPLKTRGLSQIKEALSQEGNPCLFETFVMLAGFSIFLVSNFQVNKLFGILMILSIGFGFLADMVFLPALLTRFPWLLLSPSLKTQGPIILKPSRWGQRAASWLAFVAILGVARGLEAAPPTSTLTAKEILKKTQVQVDAKDETAQVTLTIIESNGDKKNSGAFPKVTPPGDPRINLGQNFQANRRQRNGTAVPN